MWKVVGTVGALTGVLACGYAGQAERLRREAVERENQLWIEMQSREAAWRQARFELAETEKRLRRISNEQGNCWERFRILLCHHDPDDPRCCSG